MSGRQVAGSRARRGIVLTLDISIAMMVLLAVVALAYATFGSATHAGFDSQLMRSYLQDAATVMANQGYLSAPTESQNGTNTTGIREVLRATPSTVCMQVAGYGTVVGSDLAGYWKFDEDSGLAVSDSSGNGRTGIISGGGSLSSVGKNGHALSLDGTGHASVPSVNPSEQVSVTGWFKRAGPPSDAFHMLYMQGTEVQLGVYDPDGSLRASVATDEDGEQGFNSGGGLSDGKWHFVAMTYDGSAVNAYIDGNLAGTLPAAGAIEGGEPTYIGGDGNYYANGSIDEMRVYTRALTQQEISMLYSNPSNILYVVDKPDCAFSGGEVQSLTIPFVSSSNQVEDNYYYATLRAWLAGAGK